jgi:hypothetical protein
VENANPFCMFLCFTDAAGLHTRLINASYSPDRLVYVGRASLNDSASRLCQIGVPVTDGVDIAPAESEGCSDSLPEGGVLCGFPDPSSGSCVSRSCIPGNRENATVAQLIGLAQGDAAIRFSMLGEA